MNHNNNTFFDNLILQEGLRRSAKKSKVYLDITETSYSASNWRRSYHHSLLDTTASSSITLSAMALWVQCLRISYLSLPWVRNSFSSLLNCEWRSIPFHLATAVFQGCYLRWTKAWSISCSTIPWALSVSLRNSTDNALRFNSKRTIIRYRILILWGYFHWLEHWTTSKVIN